MVHEHSLHRVPSVMKWSLAACTFCAHPRTSACIHFCIFQTYSINTENARNCSTGKITKFSFVPYWKFWNKISPAGCPATCEASRNAVALRERSQFYSTWIPSGCSRWTAHPAHHKPSGRGGLLRMETWRHFHTQFSAHHSPFSPGDSSPFLPRFAKGWCLKSHSPKWAQGYKLKKKSCYYFCLLLLFNMSSPLVCKLMGKKSNLCFQQAAVSIF